MASIVAEPLAVVNGGYVDTSGPEHVAMRLGRGFVLAIAAAVATSCTGALRGGEINRPASDKRPRTYVSCEVRDAMTRRPIDGANCAIAGESRPTNALGLAAFLVLHGPGVLVVTAPDYETAATRFLATAAGPLYLTFFLTRPGSDSSRQARDDG